MAHGTRSYVTGSGLLAEDVLDDHDRLGVADVGELRGVDEVADGVHAGLAGAAVARRPRRSRGRSTLTAVPVRPSWSAKGRRPTDTTTASTSTGSPPSTRTVVPPLPVGLWPMTFTPVRM